MTIVHIVVQPAAFRVILHNYCAYRCANGSISRHSAQLLCIPLCKRQHFALFCTTIVHAVVQPAAFRVILHNYCAWIYIFLASAQYAAQKPRQARCDLTPSLRDLALSCVILRYSALSYAILRGLTPSCVTPNYPAQFCTNLRYLSSAVI